MKYCLGKMYPNWAKGLKCGQNFSRSGQKKSTHGFVLIKETSLLAKHLRTRLGHNWPQAVCFVTEFSYFSLVLVPSPGMGPLISLPTVGFVLSQNRTVHLMIPQSPDSNWAPVPGGLGRPPWFSAVHEPCRELSLHGWAHNGATTNYGITRIISIPPKTAQEF